MEIIIKLFSESVLRSLCFCFRYLMCNQNETGYTSQKCACLSNPRGLYGISEWLSCIEFVILCIRVSVSYLSGMGILFSPSKDCIPVEAINWRLHCMLIVDWLKQAVGSSRAKGNMQWYALFGILLLTTLFSCSPHTASCQGSNKLLLTKTKQPTIGTWAHLAVGTS